MSDIVYKPTSEYKPSINTPQTKFPLLSSVILFGTREIISGSLTSNIAGVNSKLIYTVPNGYTLFIFNGTYTSSSEAIGQTYVYLGYNEIYHVSLLDDKVVHILNIKYDLLKCFEGETIIIAIDDTGPNSTILNVQIVAYLVNNTLLNSMY